MFRDVFWAASSSSVNGRTWDRAHLTTEPRYANRGQRVADYYTLVPKALVGLFAAFAPRLQNQRVCPTCSSLRGAGLVSVDVCDPMPGLLVGQCVPWSLIVLVPILLSAVGSLHPGLLFHTLKQHLPSEEDSCKIHPRLCFGATLCHLVIAVSLRVSSLRFQLFPRKCLSTGCAAGRQQGCEAFRMTATNCFCMRSSMFLPTDPAGKNTLQTSAPTHDDHGRLVFLKNTSSPTASLNTNEVGERHTIGPAGRFCASQAPHLCLACTSVRLDGCPIFS